MAGEKKYVSVLNYPVVVNGVTTTEDLYIKDAEAREALGDLIEEVSNGFHYRGISTTEITDGATTGPWTIDGVVYVADNVTPSGSQVALQAGDIAAYGSEDYIWSTTSHKWRKFGTTGRLGALAYKDSASGSYTPAGSNASSTVTFASGTGTDFVTGYNNDAVAPSFTGGTFSAGTLPSFTEGAFSAGTLPSFTEGAFTAASLGTGFYTAGTAPSFTEGAFSQGTLPSLGNPTKSNFNTDAVKITGYDETAEKLTFGAAATAQAVTAQGTFSAGTLPSKAADTFNAGTMASIDVTKFNGGSKASDTWSAGTLPSKAADTWDAGTLPSHEADTFSAGSAATLAKSKAITASDTGTAAAQTFTGTAATITVS